MRNAPLIALFFAEIGILQNIANMLKVKTLVTLSVIAVFIVLALRGDISSDNIMIIVTSVISFYFGVQHEKGGGES